jgi:isopenicillin N synthase-like dioxygenase
MPDAGDFSRIPAIDVRDLVAGGPGRFAVAAQLGQACRESGFFYAVGHGVDGELQRRLRELSQRFFAQDLDTKLRIRMSSGGRAWRGYFPVGDELTSGKPDQKEGIYFGQELPRDDPACARARRCTGRTCFPPSRRRCARPCSRTWRR